MELIFLLTLPGLVILIIILGVIRLVRAKITGKPRPGSASTGLDMLDTLLRPGSEHRHQEIEQKRIIREEQGSEGDPNRDHGGRDKP